MMFIAYFTTYIQLSKETASKLHRRSTQRAALEVSPFAISAANKLPLERRCVVSLHFLKRPVSLLECKEDWMVTPAPGARAGTECQCGNQAAAHGNL